MAKIDNIRLRRRLERMVRKCVDNADCNLMERVLDIITLHYCQVSSPSAKEIQQNIYDHGIGLLDILIRDYENDALDFPYISEGGYLRFTIDCEEVDGAYDIANITMQCGCGINFHSDYDDTQQEEIKSKDLTFSDKADIVLRQYDKWNIPIALLSKSEDIYTLVERLYDALAKHPVIGHETYNQWVTRVAVEGYSHHQKKMGATRKEPTREEKLKRMEERNRQMLPNK